MYSDRYDNTQTYSPFFNEYLDDLATYLVFEKSVQQCRIVEIGCGKGLFLRKLVEFENIGNLGYGFDPSYVGPKSDLNGRLKYINTYFDHNYKNIAADVIICRHVIEHIADPLNFLRSIKEVLVSPNKTRIFFETPCVDWILQNRVIWDFFYEHCSYFNKNSLTTAFEIAGYQVEGIKHVFEGQYLWIELSIAMNKPLITKKPPYLKLINNFKSEEENLRKTWKNKLSNYLEKGNIAVWGAGAKGVTFANLFDPNRSIISNFIDLNPNKIGRYIPGTGHSIISYKEINENDIKSAILLNHNYYEEIRELLKNEAICINIVY